MEELTIDLYEVADSGPGGAFRGKGDRNFHPKVLMDSGEKKQVKAKLVRVIPGTFDEDGGPAALLVFEFNFHMPSGRRFKHALITVTFEDGKGASILDPEVYRISPEGRYALDKVTDPKDVSHTVDAAVNGGITGASVELGYHWKMDRNTETKHSGTLRGLSRRFKTYGEETSAVWEMEEDPVIKEEGIPTFLRTAVILRLDDESDGFQFTVEIETCESKLFFGSRSSSRKIDPFVVDPGSIPLAKKEKINTTNLGEADLSSQLRIATEANIYSPEATRICITAHPSAAGSPACSPISARHQLMWPVGSDDEPGEPRNKGYKGYVHETEAPALFLGASTNAVNDLKDISTTAMSRNLCFIVVGGITKLVTPDDDPSRLVKKLKVWFPKCRCIVHNPFVSTAKFATGKELMDEQAKLLLDKVSLSLAAESRLQYEDCLGENQALASSGLVFLGHDIGGSLIMKALVLASRKGSSYQQVAEDTIATLLMSAMKDLPDILSEISESFSGISGSYKLFNVFEQTTSTTKSSAIISEYSATSDPFISENFGVSRCHADLFDIHDGDALAGWLKLKLESLENAVDETTSTPDQYRYFIRELAKIDKNLHQIPGRTPASGSMDWINTHSGFKKWVSAQEIRFLHICGSPGSGATTLAAHIVGLVREKHSEKETYFLGFSFNKQDVYGSSTETMVLSFVRQLLSKRPNLFRHAVRLSTWITQRKCTNENTLWVLFWSLISHLEDGQVVIIIRAIQESSSPVDDIVDYLYSLQGLAKLGVKIIITSNYENEETPVWAKSLSAHLHTIQLEDDEGTSWRLSVKALVRSRVDRLLESRASCRNLSCIIVEAFWSSTPSFYWAMAKLDILEAQMSGMLSTRRTMLEKLNQFPSTIPDLFNVMVQRIPPDYINWIQPGQGLSWIMYSLRPLTSSEFAVAVAFDQVDAIASLKFDEFGDTISSDLPGDINRIAGPWVEVDDWKVGIVNARLKDLLLARYTEDESIIETRLLLKCIRYLDWVDLQVRNNESGEERREPQEFRNSTQFNLVPYASVYWPEHFQRAAPVSSIVLEEVLAFLENKLQFWSSLVRRYQTKPFNLEASESPLKMSASLGLTQVVDEMLSYIEKPISKEKQKPIQESMMLAIEHGHSKIALSLYEMHPSCKAPELHRAAAGGFNELLSGFLAFDSVKAAINSYDTVGYTALHYAAQHGHVGTVNMLLENGASAKLTSDDGAKKTALHLAVGVANSKLIKSLLNDGADAGARDSSGYNVVALSAEGGFDEVMRFLFDDEKNVQMVWDSVHNGNTPLHLAAMYGHTSTCEYLVQLQADIKAVNNNHETPLYLAVRGGFLGIVKLLLKFEKESRDDPKQTQEIGGSDSEQNIASPLQIAAELGYTDIIQLLLKYENYATGDDIAKSLRLAAAEDDAESAKVLLDKTTDTDAADPEGNTALHVASSHGHAELVCILLDSGKFNKDVPNEGGMAAMHLAAREGHARAVATIVKHNGSVEITNANGDTPLHLAAARGSVEVVEVLCAVNPSIRNKMNHEIETPLILAAKRGHTAVVKALLHVPGSQSEDNEGNDRESHTEVWGDFYPLHTSALEGHDALVRLLVTEEKYDINIRRVPDQQTPIHAAVRSNSATIINLLIDLGADVTAADQDKDTALHIAAAMDCLEACKALLSLFSSSSIEAIDLLNNANETPLYQACNWGHANVVQLLLDDGADYNIRCHSGWTPLHVAAAWGESSVVRLLLDKTADYSALNDYESTPIILAAEEGHFDVISMLMEAGAVADVVNSTGSTALHRAAQGGYLKSVELLVEKGHADCNLPKKNGLTPMHLAAAHGHVDVIEYLLKKGAQLSTTAETFGTPLGSAMKSGQFHVVKVLVDKGASTTVDMSNPASWGNNTEILEFVLEHPSSFNFAFSAYALQQAIISFNDDLVSVLVEKITDVNEECEPYKTVLQAAAWMGMTSVMKKLLQKGANPNIKGGNFGSALHAAIADQDLQSVTLLLNHNADPAVQHQGEGAIFFAIRAGALEVVTALLNKMDSTARAAKDKNGCSLLACAISMENQPVADYLFSLEHVPIHDKDLGGRTPLMVAVMHENAPIVKKLLERLADPNAIDMEGKTPLIRAIASHNINSEIVTALLEHPNFDPAVQDCRGRTYAYWAARLGIERNSIESGASESAKDRINCLLPNKLVLHAAFASGLESVVMEAIDNMQSEDLAELDGDGWTAIYTAARYKVDKMDEFKAKFKALLGSRPSSPTPKKPRKWHKQDRSPCLQVSSDGKIVTVMSRPANLDYMDQPVAVIRADHAMPGNQMYYFEAEIMEDANDKIIGVGFCEEHAPLNRMLGWDKGSWGYHGDNGNLYTPSGGTEYGPLYAKGSVVGCGVDFDKEITFFTLDGVSLAFREIKGKLYPAVCFDSESGGSYVLANFGQKPFKFDTSKWNAEEALAKPPLRKPATEEPISSAQTVDSKVSGSDSE
ncbi:hypothetical protein V498_06811 [Pseudogymnoascus sp. VKM F-4517 (FW-2822)]|nr:hypothetical protein V498_06811 [Pseudogymnoascus sp. VKM F-4517 (FW-2822)]